MRVVGLFRVSTEKQANEGASLDAQERRFDQLVATNGWKVVAKLRGCESASKAGNEREVLQQTLRAIRDHDADAVYVHEQSRLTRGDELDVALLMRELRERRVKVLVGGHVRDLDSIDERFMVRIQAVVDRAESERIVERSKRGKRERAQQGRWTTGEAPFGYRNPPKGDDKRGTLQVVPEQAEVVRRIFQAVASGQTVNSLWVRLNREGVRTPSGKGRWGNTTLRRMLDNPVYAGTLETLRWQHKDGAIKRQPAKIVVDGAHEAIVDRKTWDEVQRRTTMARRRGVTPALLTGLLWTNGKRLVADAASKSRRFYYADGGPYLGRDEVDRSVWEGFLRLIKTPVWVSEIHKALATQDGSDRQATAEMHARTVAQLERRLDGLTTMRADGEIGREEFERRAGTVRSQLTEARRALRGCSCDEPPKTDLDKTVKALAAVLREGVALPHRRRLMESVIDRVDTKAHKPHGSKRWAITDIAFHIGVIDRPRRSWGFRTRR